MDATTREYLNVMDDCDDLTKEIMAALHDDTDPDNILPEDLRRANEIKKRLQKVWHYIEGYRAAWKPQPSPEWIVCPACQRDVQYAYTDHVLYHNGERARVCFPCYERLAAEGKIYLEEN